MYRYSHIHSMYRLTDSSCAAKAFPKPIHAGAKDLSFVVASIDKKMSYLSILNEDVIVLVHNR